MNPAPGLDETARQSDEHRSQSMSIDLHGLAEDAELLAEAIVDTVRESLLILDDTLSIRLANRSFYLNFGVSPEETLDRLVYEVGNGQWDIPRLRELLEKILPHDNSFRDFEVTHEFPRIRSKTMLLNGKKLRRRGDQRDLILLAIEDVTELREHERSLVELLKQKQTLVQEIHHRVKNNLHVIVSLLGLHAQQAGDPLVIEALSEAKGRVKAIARVHETLYASDNLAELNFGEYLRHLTKELEDLHSRAEIALQVFTDDIVLSMDTAIPLGLIANELIVNCFKHAFPSGRPGKMIVSAEYVRDGMGPDTSLDDAAIRLRVQDDGIGLPSGVDVNDTATMGLRVVQLLGRQLRAEVEARNERGLSLTVTVPPAAKP
jgi:two-component sensor histidine kinase